MSWILYPFTASIQDKTQKLIIGFYVKYFFLFHFCFWLQKRKVGKKHQFLLAWWERKICKNFFFGAFFFFTFFWTRSLVSKLSFYLWGVKVCSIKKLVKLIITGRQDVLWAIHTFLNFFHFTFFFEKMGFFFFFWKNGRT